jgi:protein-lysine N-methyltransferase EEF2KMT
MQHLRQQERESYSLFRRQYLQLLNPVSLTFPASDCLQNESFQSLIYEGIFKPGVLVYPPQARYQLRVLKELVLRVEKSIVNPEEDVRRVFLYRDFLFQCNV